MSGKSPSNHGGYRFTRILVPTDGSANARRALYVGIDLANKYGAELFVLHAIPIPTWLVTVSAYGGSSSGLDSYYERQEDDANHFVGEAVDTAKAQGVVKARGEVSRANGSIIENIIETVNEKGIDLIVIGTRGLGGFKKLLQGSVSSGVVTHAHCNVLVVR